MSLPPCLPATTPGPRPVAEGATWAAAFEALRVRQWLHFCALPAAGFDAAAHGISAASALRLGRGAAIAAMSLAYAYGINAITDRAMDRDRHKNPLAGQGSLSPVVPAVVVSTAMTALALAATAGPIALVATALSVTAATLYSAGPRAKTAPILGTVLNVPIFAPLLAVALDGVRRPHAFGLLLAAFVALLVQNQLLHELADADEDARAGIVTTAQLLGRRVALAIVGVSALGAFAAIWVAPSWGLGALAVASVMAGCGPAFALLEPTNKRALHQLVAVAAGAVLFVAVQL